MQQNEKVLHKKTGEIVVILNLKPLLVGKVFGSMFIQIPVRGLSDLETIPDAVLASEKPKQSRLTSKRKLR